MKWLGVTKFLQTYTFCSFIIGLGSFVKSDYVRSVCTILSLVKPVSISCVPKSWRNWPKEQYL